MHFFVPGAFSFSLGFLIIQTFPPHWVFCHHVIHIHQVVHVEKFFRFPGVPIKAQITTSAHKNNFIAYLQIQRTMCN